MANIEIKRDKGLTKICVNGVDFSGFATAFVLGQTSSGELPLLVVEIPIENADIEIPDGVTVVRRKGCDADEARREASDRCD